MRALNNAYAAAASSFFLFFFSVYYRCLVPGSRAKRCMEARIKGMPLLIPKQWLPLCRISPLAAYLFVFLMKMLLPDKSQAGEGDVAVATLDVSIPTSKTTPRTLFHREKAVIINISKVDGKIRNVRETLDKVNDPRPLVAACDIYT